MSGVRARWSKQETRNRHMDAGIKANNENLLALEVKLAKLAARVESLEAPWWRRWFR